MRIRQLPVLIANQIAAGEVIERPASVLKELLENALDAGADTIHIDIGFGGLNQIKVSDNGSGIVADDLTLAVAAHATSKIIQLEDLYRISTLGFRGEALASISSVARVTISSKPARQAHAMMIQVDETGTMLLPCARSQGTTVDVRDLFYNAPVRKKFLKSERSEFQAIEALVRQFALSAPAIAITLKHQDKLILSLPAAVCDKSRLVRIKKLLGKDFIEQALYLDVEEAGIRLCGWISNQAYQRNQRDKQWMYLNQRMVKDKLLFHALQKAYQPWLHPGRFPACLLYFTLPVGAVDVNVHPTKQEVRFHQPRLVHDFIVSSVVHVLESQQVTSFSDDLMDASPNILAQIHVKSNFATTSAINPGERSFNAEELTYQIINAEFAVIFIASQPYLVHLTRAYQAYCHALLESQPRPIPCRPLLVPIHYDIDKTCYDLFEQYQSVLSELGLQFDFLNTNKLLVRTIPSCLPGLDIGLLIKNISMKWLEQDQLINQLALCQTFDPRQCEVDALMELTAHLQGQQALPSYCIRLDLDTCLGMMHHA